MHGWIYASPDGQAWARLLSIDDTTLQQRRAARLWADRPAALGFARPMRAQQMPELPAFFLILYQCPPGVRLLASVLSTSDPFARLDAGIAVVRQMAAWRHASDGPFFPTPYDILLDARGRLLLLALPFWWMGRVSDVFEEPSRGWYLAPELVRGHAEVDGEALDRYALGVLLWQCFRKLPPSTDAGEILERAARGGLTYMGRQVSTLPFWLERVPATQMVVATVRMLLHPDPVMRRAASWTQLIPLLEGYRAGMEPVTAARGLRATAGAADAFAFVQDVLLLERSYDLLLLAGELAGGDLGRPLAALDLLEQAIATAPERPEAYEAHVRILCAAPKSEPVAALLRRDPGIAVQLDASVERDFRFVIPERQGALEARVASYWLWRGQPRRALSFIWSRLFDNGLHLWWKIEMNLLYAVALLGGGEIRLAESQLMTVAAGLELGNQRGIISDLERQMWSEELRRLQHIVDACRNNECDPASSPYCAVDSDDSTSKN